MYHINIGGEIALVAGILIVARAQESGRKLHAGHKRSTGCTQLLYTVMHGIQMVCRAQNHAIGIQLYRRNVLYQRTKLPSTKQLVSASQLILAVGKQTLQSKLLIARRCMLETAFLNINILQSESKKISNV